MLPLLLALARPVTAGDLAYFVLVDRYADGDPSNDTAVDRSDPQAFHGGDLAGVIAHLDDMQQLGVRTIWLSPIFRTRDTRIGKWGAFHGYWTVDPYALDPRFGDEATFNALVRAAHQRGIRVVLDLVVNHVAPGSPIIAQHPDWFHHNGDITDWNDPVQLVNNDVHGLPDLAVERNDVYRWIEGAAVRWLRDGIDGYRIDAVRHVPHSFVRRLVAHLHKVSPSGFSMVGEDFEGDPVKLSRTVRDTGLDAVFDFPLYYALLDVACRDAPPARIATVLSADRLYPAGTDWWTFLDNHDLPRVATVCAAEDGRPDLDRVRRALAALLLIRGTPVITYGTEVPLTGAAEPANRTDMVFRERALYRYIQELSALRASHPALREGASRVISLAPLVVERVAPHEEALVTIGDSTAAAPLPGGLRPLVRVQGEGNEADRWATVRWSGPGASVVLRRAPDGLRLSLPPPTSVQQELRVVDVPIRDGDTVRVAGSAPELGDWDPAQALVLHQDGAAWTGTVRVPAGTVLAWKAVVAHRDGSFTWEPSDDRYTLAGSGSTTATWGR